MVAPSCSCGSELETATACANTIEQAATSLRVHFRRPEAYEHALDYLRGLVAEVERKNGWQLAEHAGYSHPRGIQRVLDRYAWEGAASSQVRWRNLPEPSGGGATVRRDPRRAER